MGKFQTQVVPLRNAGNIPIDVSLELTHHADCFATIPMQLMIEPGGQSEITIKYEPKPNTTEKVERYLSHSNIETIYVCLLEYIERFSF